MTVLLTGGAGYIGAHIGRLLRQRGTSVLVVDNLVTGERHRVGESLFVCCDLASDDAVNILSAAMREYGVTSVIHVAARKQVGESMSDPEGYYRSNIGGLANVMAACSRVGLSTFVFSSSAAVYGNPTESPISEHAPTQPMNPYGETKLAGEWLVGRAATAHGLRAASLRYFNVAGSGWDDLGDPFALNLLTIAISQLARGEHTVVYGADYPTPDGSCVRDYVHVLDLAHAHIAALDDLEGEKPGTHNVYNVGTGTGTSVREVLGALSRISGIESEPIVAPARAGDPASVIADASKIARELGWTSTRDIDDIVTSAWNAHVHRAAQTR